jgi:hypothetical protein
MKKYENIMAIAFFQFLMLVPISVYFIGQDMPRTSLSIFLGSGMFILIAIFYSIIKITINRG